MNEKEVRPVGFLGKDILAVEINKEGVQYTPEQEAAFRSATDELYKRVHREEERLRKTDEDSYVTRNEIQDEIGQYHTFIARLAERGPIVDLKERIVDYGHDPESAYTDRMSGLEYKTDFEREKETYETAIYYIKPIIENLERAGIKVERGVIAIEPHQLRDKGQEREELHRQIDVEMER